MRELAEESGIAGHVSRDLGVWETGYEDQVWAIYLCEADLMLPDHWTFFTTDDGGVDYEFFWHDLIEKPDEDWRPVYQNALEYIRKLV